jgi:hypothetical protein
VRIALPAAALCTRQRQGSHDCRNRAHCGPRIPPNHAPIYTQLTTCAEPFHPAHRSTSHKCSSGNSAMEACHA